jgi:hypothetical protein
VTGLAVEVAGLGVRDEGCHSLRGGFAVERDAELDVVEHELTRPVATFCDRRIRNVSDVLALWGRCLAYRRLRGRGAGAAVEVEDLRDSSERGNDDDRADREEVVALAAAQLASVHLLASVVALEPFACFSCLALGAFRCHLSSRKRCTTVESITAVSAAGRIAGSGRVGARD